MVYCSLRITGGQELAHNIISRILMEEYESDMSSEGPPEEINRQKAPFLYDYYLSNSIDVFENWKNTHQLLQLTPPQQQTFKYLELEFPVVTRISKFRTADIIRAKAFIFMLKKAFEEVGTCFADLFSTKQYMECQDRQVAVQRISKQSKGLERRLQSLLNYLEIVIDQNLQVYFNDDVNFEKTFEQSIFDIISKLYLYVGDLRLLWDISGSEILLVDGANHHSTSLGGNNTYYKNIMRSLLKRNWQLKELHDRLTPELSKEQAEQYPNSPFLTKVICEVLSLERVNEKDKAEFIDSMKGLYFLAINLAQKDFYYRYMLNGFHLEVLTTQRLFKDYEDLENMYVEVLQNCRQQKKLLPLTYTLEMDKLPFEKRQRSPQIQQLVLDIVYNYVAVAKSLLKEKKLFSSVSPLTEDHAFASTQELLKNQNFNGLVGILMLIQQNSKDAFSYGDIQVHRVYLEISELIKDIYLSYQHENWLFAPDMLLYIPLRYFMDTSEDIRADVKKTLFIMVEAINQDRMPFKLKFNQERQKMQTERVLRSEYLQVILYFLEECHQEEEYINLPEVIPTNLETSILYIKSMELKLNEKEPTPDQMPYVLGMLKTCENYKLSIRFRWYQSKESIEDREIEFNIEKGMPEDWMRKVYRETINQREAEQIKNHFEKYLHHKGLTILNLANIFKYCHGLNPGGQIDKKAIREEDLFTLLEEIKMVLSINFDIFSLNLDEEISLNYIHVCLSLYNSCYDETPFNEVYLMIMESIMKPYLNYPNSTLTNFKSRFPGFFEKWIYSFQIASIFQELGEYISTKGENDSYREDVINKIKMVSQLIDNKQNIKATMGIESLTQIIVMFSTLINKQSHPSVYIESIELFCLFLNTFPEVKKDVSLNFMLDESVYSDQKLADELVTYIKTRDRPYLKDQVSIINNMVQNLPQFMNIVGLKKTNEVLDIYANKLNNDFDDLLSQFQVALFEIPNEQCTLLTNIMRIVMLLKKQFEAEKGEEKMDIGIKAKTIEQSLKGLMAKEKLQEKYQFCQLIFLEDILSKINKKAEESKRPCNILIRELFHELIQRYGTNDDIIYFAEKLDFFDLILVGKKDEWNPREQAILLDLLIETKYKGNQTELIKKILRESTKLSEISLRAIDQLQKQQDRIHSHHLNKFIHINNRYPKDKIEQFIIDNIGCERNHAAVKIKQMYLIKDLTKKLEKIPKNICEELLLKPIREAQQEKNIDFISNIFEKLLYLPIKDFENVALKQTQEIQEENEDWNTESEGEPDEETKPESSNKIIEPDPKQEHSSDYEGEEEHLEEEAPSHSDDSRLYTEDDEDDFDRPPILQMFYEEGMTKELQFYSKLMVLREELDVMIDSKYEELKPLSPLLKREDVCVKLKQITHMLNSMDRPVAEEIAVRMPPQLVEALRFLGMKVEFSEELKMKIDKMKKVNKKPPKWLLQLFSDRQESDDSNIQGDDDDDDEDDDSYSDIEEEDEEVEGPGLFPNSDDEGQQIQIQIAHQKKSDNKKKKKEKEAKDLEDEIPGLVPTYSNVEQQISGTELKREEILKILEIALYWLLHLPESQVKTRQVTSFYMDILQSNMGQIFFQSFMTVIRFDETKNNLQSYIRSLSSESHPKIELGLQFVSMQGAINNILYLIKQYQDSNRDKENYSNLLFKESGSLLPIAEQMLTKFDLPIQNNCLTLLLVYISSNKEKIRKKISALDFTLKGNELENNKTQYKLKHAQLVRLIDKICKSGSSCSIWETIESSMELKVNHYSKLFTCIKGYGSHLYRKLMETGQKIMKTINNSEKELSIHHPDVQNQKLHNIENMHRIISKLVSSVKDEIKQFYFINKVNIKHIMEEQNEDLYEEIQSVKKIPKKLLNNNGKIFHSKELMDLLEAVMYFIKILKDQFYGKIEDKLFSKMIHYPKMVVEAIWYYIFIFKEYKKYKWLSPSEIELFYKQHPFIGSYKFNNLQEVFGLVIYFFNLESFCTDKFKQFFLPVLMKNHQFSKEIPLMFKIPKTDQDQDVIAQSILVTRKCSFDMAFYQVTGQAIQVQFHEEEGSDHGGLVRELMIGWKGRGVGEEAFFIGKILGISFKQGVPYGGALDIGMFVAITNYKVVLDFFKEVDPQIYKSLKYIKDNDPEPLYLKFEVSHQINGKTVSFELVEGGKDIDLVEKNKQKYLQLYMQRYFYLGRQKELEELKLGFNTVVYPEYAEIFTPLEMMRQIKGEEIVDVKMLISKARYEGYSAESAVIKWFWELVQSFDQEKMNIFIQFLTGSPKITVYNSNFSITIQKVYDIDCLPVAHTCFNTIDLPQYSTKEILEKKFLTAILEGNNSFGIL